MKKTLFGIMMSLTALFVVPSIVSAEPTEGTNWAKIVTKMTNKLGNAVTITSDDSQMVISMTDSQTGEIYSVTYYQANDIVTFNSNNTTNDIELAKFEALVNKQLISSVAEYYGYDVELFFKWLSEVDHSTLTLGDSGIEFTKYTVNSITSLKTLKINIECGISPFHAYKPEPTPEPTPVPEPTPTPESPKVEVVTPNVETKVENPKTGLFVSMTIAIVAILSVFIFVVTKKKNYFSKI